MQRRERYIVSPSTPSVRDQVVAQVKQVDDALFGLNQEIHKHPETAFEEFRAHDVICEFLEKNDFVVTRKAFGLPTSFEARFGTEGPLINFTAEYDALSNIGHACGHNLIATAGIAAFLGLAHALKQTGSKGRIQLLGTPAEEDGGGKIKLYSLKAYDDVIASLMIHPTDEFQFSDENAIGASGQTSIANVDLIAKYKGRPAHAAGNPWDGVNALDAVVAAYVNVSLLRQQILPDDRIHGCILNAPKVTNIIPDHTEIKYSIRSATITRLKILKGRVHACIASGALAAGCEVSVEESLTYEDLRVNTTLCSVFTEEMKALDAAVITLKQDRLSASTDMGNISQKLPGLHAMIGIPAETGAYPHNDKFAAAAGTKAAHDRAVLAGTAMAMAGWRIITDAKLRASVREDFSRQK